MLTLGLIGWFVLLTRAEPSVLRAGTMAALSATAFVLGRQREPVRLLALAVVGLLLVDPLLAWSVGFWLSVGATAGVTAVGPWLAPRLGVLGPLALPVAVTVGAQLGVAVPSLLVFGRLSLVGTVANLVAVPVAGLVMLVRPARLPGRRRRSGRRPGRHGARRRRRALDRRRRHRRRGRRARAAVVVARLARRDGARRRADRPGPAEGCDDDRPMTAHLLTGDDESLVRAAASDARPPARRRRGPGARRRRVRRRRLRAGRVVDAAQTPPFLTDTARRRRP